MAENPISPPLPADLPEDWAIGQTVAPSGAEAGLSEQHVYNYLMKQVNAAQTGVNRLGGALAETLRPFGPVAVTIPLSWAGSGPWTQEVAVEGVTADMELLHLSLAKNTDSAAGKAQEQGIVCVTYCETVDRGLLLTCRDKKPTVAISCILKGAERYGQRDIPEPAGG